MVILCCGSWLQAANRDCEHLPVGFLLLDLHTAWCTMPWIKVLNPNYSRQEREGWSCWKERERQNQRDLPYLAASSLKAFYGRRSRPSEVYS